MGKHLWLRSTLVKASMVFNFTKKGRHPRCFVLNFPKSFAIPFSQNTSVELLQVFVIASTNIIISREQLVKQIDGKSENCFEICVENVKGTLSLI